MIDLENELFSLVDRFDAICVTTNSVVGNDGRAVMGGGCALECARRWPETPAILGQLLTDSGVNVPFQLGVINVETLQFVTEPFVEDDLSDVEEFMKIKQSDYCRLFSFPTKRHFKDTSPMALIRESCYHMTKFADVLQMEHIAIPRPGSGLGGLNYDDVREQIKNILDDRFYIVHLPGK